MPGKIDQLIAIAKSLDPKKRFVERAQLLEALRAEPAKLKEFKRILASASPKEFAGLKTRDGGYGGVIRGAADDLNLLPDRPRPPAQKGKGGAKSRKPDEVAALCQAVIKNDVDTVRQLAEKVDVNQFDETYHSPLAHAVINNRVECAKILLAAGADPNLVMNWGETILHLAARGICSKKLFQVLVAAGGDLLRTNDHGSTVKQVLKIHHRFNWQTAS